MARWPERMLPLVDVAEWIADALPGRPVINGPLAVLRAKSWGVTARFRSTTSHGESSVIFKAIWLPRFGEAGHTASLLTRINHGDVPDLLAWSRVAGMVWMLFEDVEGRRPRASLRVLLQAALAIARVQADVAALAPMELVGLPRAPLVTVPDMFDALLHVVRTKHIHFWQEDGQDLARQFALDATVADRLERALPAIHAWTYELESEHWPLSIDHVDLQLDNVLVRTDGRLLLLDWEEANLSCPFFSIDLLLDDVPGHSLPLDDKFRSPYTSGQREVIDAYVRELPWKSFTERRKAVELALCLAPIKHAYEAEMLAQALGWEEGAPHIVAWAIGRALPRWRQMTLGRPVG